MNRGLVGHPWPKAFRWPTWCRRTKFKTRGAWAKIEADPRQYVLRAKGDVFVFTGPVFATKPRTNVAVLGARDCSLQFIRKPHELG